MRKSNLLLLLSLVWFQAMAVDIGNCPAEKDHWCTSRGHAFGTTCTNSYTGQLHSHNGSFQTTFFRYWCSCEPDSLSIDIYCSAQVEIPNTSTSPSADNPARICGSIINVDSGTVMEKVPVAGTPFNLVYSSERTIGYGPAYKFTLPITGSTYPSDIQSFEITVNYSDRTDNSSLTPSADLNFNFQWDGKNNSGNYVQGGVKAQVDVEEVATGRTYPDTPLTYHFDLGNWNTTFVGLGGWTISAHHFYNTSQKRLYLGNGDARYVESTSLSGGGHRVASKDGSEVYDFDASGNHLYTRHGLTGAIIYTFAYDGSGRLASITDAFSNQTTVVRDISGSLTGISSPDNQLTSLTLDSNGLLYQITNPNNETHTITYWSSEGLLKTFETPKGLVSTMTYDTNGNLASDSDSIGALASLVKSLISGNLSVSVTSAEGRVTQHTIYRHLTPGAYERSTTNPRNSTTHYYEDQTQSYIQGGALNLNTTKVSDPRFGEQTPFHDYVSISSGTSYMTVQNSRTATLSTPSDPFSIQSLIYSSNVNNQTSTITYTGSTKTFTETSPEGRIATSTLNTNGQLVSYQNSTLTPINFNYDSRGRLWKVEQGARFTSWTFDSNGYVNSWTNSLNQTTTTVNDSVGRPLTITYPDTRVLSLTYDANGSIASVTPPGKTAHSIVTNLWNLIASYLPPSLGGTASTDYTYNNDKQLTQIDRPMGQTIVFGYNATSGALNSMTAPNDSYTYDEDMNTGKISTASDPLSTSNYLTYSGEQLGSETVYDSVTFNLNGYTTFTYDNNFRLSQEVLTASDWMTTSTISYSYDDDGLLTTAGNQTLTYNAVTGLLSGTSLGLVTDTYGYNSFGEVTSYVAQYNGIDIYEYTLTRDDLGRVTTKVETLGGVTDTYIYSYDVTGRLEDVTKNGLPYSHYNYDSNNNIISGNRGGVTISASYDAQDRISTWGTKTYTHNLNGELTQIANSSPVQNFNLRYNDLGYLKSVQTPSATVDYQVDALQRRAVRSVGSVIQEKYIYNSRNFLMAEMSDLGAIVNHYVYSSKAHVPDYLASGGVDYRIITDHLGSVRMVVNSSTGAQNQIIEYDEYGKVLSDTNPGFQAFGFAGGMYDPETGLVHFQHRDYDPETGRWLSKDPILFGGGDTNLYGYVLSDPVNLIDPNGLWSIYFGYGAGYHRESSPGSGSGSSRSHFTGVGYDSSGGGFSFHTSGNGNGATGLFGGGGIGFGFFTGSIGQFFGGGVSSGVALGWGTKGAGASYFESDSGGWGMQFDFFGIGGGAGAGRQRTCTTPAN